MLCCCRRRGTYTTTAVQPSYISEPKKKHVVKTTVTVPSQPTQEQTATPSRPVSSNIPSVHHSTNTNSVDRTTSNQNGNTASVKTTEESNNHHKETKSTSHENIVSISKVQNTNHVNSADNNRPTVGENTEPVIQVQQTVNSTKLAENQNTEPVIKAQEINNSHNSGEKTRALDQVGTEPISVVQINTNPDNSGAKARTLEQVNTEPVIEVEKNTNTTHFGEKRSFEKDNTESVTKTEENIGHLTSADKSISQLSESSAFQDNSNQENPVEEAVVANNLNKEENKESDRTKQIIVSHQIIEDNSIPTPVIRTKLPQSNQSIDQTEVSISTAITQKANSQSDKAQANTDNILTGASIKLKRHQNEQLSKPEQENTTDRTKQVEEDDMKRRSLRKIIPIDVNNDDIKAPVPLIPRRSSILRNISTETNIQEEQEDVEEPEQVEIPELSDDDDDGADVGQHKVTFGEVNEYYTQERREGIREAITVDTTMEIPKYPKSAEDVLHLKDAFAANDFLRSMFKEETLYKVIDAMTEREVTAGEAIIQEGDPGNNLYVSMKGTYEIYVKKKLFSTFSDQRVFGELAILYNSKRLATIKAVSDGKVWVLKRSDYQQIVVQFAIQEFEETLTFLRNVPLVNKLNEESLNKIANLLKKEFFKTDTVIVSEGEPGDKFYIIRAGSVAITKEKEGKVSELGRGAFFGERALLNNEPRQATVTANAPGVECLTLTSVEFRKHFNDISVQSQNKPQPTVSEPVVSEPKGTKLPQNEYSHIELEDLKTITTLGEGGFGRVDLVQHKNEPKLAFALKYMEMSHVVEQEQVEHAFNERDIQMSCDCVFIARMYKTYKDDVYLYYLMESCLGGDLWNYLKSRRTRMLPETSARFYAACVFEALSYLHERNTIYRDLKPENLLIDSRGYIKLTDFGFAKALKTAAKTYTFAGTPEYVAPEIIFKKGHDKSVDYWEFGILIYELLAGKTPFKADDPTNMTTYNRILRGIDALSFPKCVGASAEDLIKKLCRPIPTDRLGNQKNGIEDIRNHRWFQGFEWEKLRNRRIKAPFVPKLSNNVDTKYFEESSEKHDIPLDLVSSGRISSLYFTDF